MPQRVFFCPLCHPEGWWWNQNMTVMRCKIFLVTLLFGASVLGAATARSQSNEECIDRDPIATVVIIPGSDARGSSTSAYFPLSVGSSTLTRAAVTVHWQRGEGGIRFVPTFHYNLPGQVGLAYNIYQLTWLVPSSATDQYQRITHDLTHGCASPGVGIFPNQQWEARQANYTGAVADGQPIVLLIWGRM